MTTDQCPATTDLRGKLFVPSAVTTVRCELPRGHWHRDRTAHTATLEQQPQPDSTLLPVATARFTWYDSGRARAVFARRRDRPSMWRRIRNRVGDTVGYWVAVAGYRVAGVLRVDVARAGERAASAARSPVTAAAAYAVTDAADRLADWVAHVSGYADPHDESPTVAAVVHLGEHAHD